MIEGVLIIVLNDNGEILFYEEQKEIGFGRLRIPGGHIEDLDKSIYDTAKREFFEEFGSHIEILDQIGEIICEFNNKKFKNHIVLCKFVGKRLKPNVDEFVAKPIWLSLEDYKMIELEKTFEDVRRVVSIYQNYLNKMNNY